MSSGSVLDPRMKTNEDKLLAVELLHDDCRRRTMPPAAATCPSTRSIRAARCCPKMPCAAASARSAPFKPGRESAQNIKTQQDGLAEVALNTGGRAFLNQSDLTRAVREIVRENGSYYLLGFSPNPPARDGKFHDIDVKVKRPGLRVRSRYGYVAAAPAAATSDSTKPALDTAMSAGVNVSGLSLQAIVSPLAPAAERHAIGGDDRGDVSRAGDGERGGSATTFASASSRSTRTAR